VQGLVNAAGGKIEHPSQAAAISAKWLKRHAVFRCHDERQHLYNYLIPDAFCQLLSFVLRLSFTIRHIEIF